MTPRASGFWTEGMTDGYFSAEDDVEQRLIDDDGRTPVRCTSGFIQMPSLHFLVA